MPHQAHLVEGTALTAYSDFLPECAMPNGFRAVLNQVQTGASFAYRTFDILNPENARLDSLQDKRCR